MWVLLLCGALDVQNYDVALDLDLNTGSIAGRASVTFAAPPARVTLSAGGLRVTRVMAGGAALAFHRQGDELIIDGVSAKPVVIDYQGTPKKGLFLAKQQAYTSFHTAEWLPCNDDPSDRATLKLALTVPEALTTVSVGEPVTKAALAGRRTDTWSLATPASAFLFAFAVGRFHHVEEELSGVRWHYYSARHSEAELRRVFAAMPQIYRVLANVADTPLPTKTYRQVLLDADVAQEGAGIALMADAGEEWAIAHELAHQWWGVSIGISSWEHFWLNEGIATYVTALDKERRNGPADYAREMALALHRIRDERGLVGAQGKLAYAKGALFLHSLREKLGSAAFFSALGKYTKESLGKTVTTQVFEHAFGDAAKELFRRWAYTNEVSAQAEPMTFLVAPELDVTQLERGVYRASEKDVNALAVELTDGTIFLVDALETPVAMEAFVGWLDVRFGKPRMLAVNTHFHHDRTGGNEALLKRNIAVWGSDKTVQLMKREPKLKGANHVFQLIPKQVFKLGTDRVELIFAGAGHTPDNIAVFFPARGLLFGGCMVRPDGHLGPTEDADLPSWSRAIEVLMSLNPKRVIPGHGPSETPDALDVTARAIEEQL